MNSSHATPAPAQPQKFGQRCLTLAVRGQGQFVERFTVESDAGFALWLEGRRKALVMSGPWRAAVTNRQGLPFLAMYDMAATPVPDCKWVVPCVDIMGLIELGDDVRAYRDELADEQSARSLH